MLSLRTLENLRRIVVVTLIKQSTVSAPAPVQVSGCSSALPARGASSPGEAMYGRTEHPCDVGADS